MNATQLNPFITKDSRGEFDEDAASAIEGALEFIADAITVIDQAGGLSSASAYGVNRLLMCCAAAIHYMRRPEDTGEQK